MDRHCCYIDEATGDSCPSPAEWVITHGAADHEYTESCTAHVGPMLMDGPQTVTPIRPGD